VIHRPTADAVPPWNACKATIREQRGAALGKVLATFVQIRQVGDESTPRLTLARREVLHPCHKRLVGEVNHRGERGGIHGSCIPSGCRTPQECPGCAATAPVSHAHSGLRALRLDDFGTRQRHPRLTPRGPADRGRKRVKPLVLAMKTCSSTQLGPDWDYLLDTGLLLWYASFVRLLLRFDIVFMGHTVSLFDHAPRKQSANGVLVGQFRWLRSVGH